MAGDWIKLQHATPDKPEIGKIAEILGIDPDAAFGKFLRWMIWADQNTDDGNAICVTTVTLDRVTYQPGFADAMAEVGWLTGESGNYSIPNFLRHNGKSAKKRAETAIRVKKHREKRDDCNAESVTPETQTKREKRNQRREEKSIKERESAHGEIDVPTLDEMTQEAEMRGIPADTAKACWEHYEGKNLWLNRHGRLINWRQCLITWQRNEEQKPAPKVHGTIRPESPWSIQQRINAITSDIESARNNDAFFDAVDGIRLDSDPMNEKGRNYVAKLKSQRAKLRDQLKGAH